MRKWIALVMSTGLALTGCTDQGRTPVAPSDDTATPDVEERGWFSQEVVVANRASGSISVIDGRRANLRETIDLPMNDGDATPEPMYVVHVKPRHRVFVGDRANNRVVAFDDRTYDVEGMAPAGDGVFHMWADKLGRQLWVNNDVDNTTSVIDPRRLDVIATVPTPADLVAEGGKPHDVIVGPFGIFAYVSVVGLPGDHDYVIQYSTHSFEELNRAAVGKDSHLSVAIQHNRLYVPCQNTNEVIVLNRFTMEEIDHLDVPGAHGAGMSRNGRTFYTANLPGGGTDALYTIDTRTNELIGEPVDSPYPVPHNIALSPDGRRLFLTHSGGTSDKVTVYRTSRWDPTPEYVGEVTVGLNPFGLAYVR